MGVWYETIDIREEHSAIQEGNITCQEYAKILIPKIESSRYFSENSKYEIISLLDDIVYNNEATSDEVDVALEMLYDCADEDRVWIKAI